MNPGWFPFVPRPGVGVTMVVGPAIPVEPRAAPDPNGRSVVSCQFFHPEKAHFFPREKK